MCTAATGTDAASLAGCHRPNKASGAVTRAQTAEGAVQRVVPAPPVQIGSSALERHQRSPRLDGGQDTASTARQPWDRPHGVDLPLRRALSYPVTIVMCGHGAIARDWPAQVVDGTGSGPRERHCMDTSVKPAVGRSARRFPSHLSATATATPRAWVARRSPGWRARRRRRPHDYGPPTMPLPRQACGGRE